MGVCVCVCMCMCKMHDNTLPLGLATLIMSSNLLITSEPGKIALALSAGGSRAAAFASGVLYQLTIDKIKTISCVSGGGFLGAALMQWLHHRAMHKTKELNEEIMRKLLTRLHSNAGFLMSPIEPPWTSFFPEEDTTRSNIFMVFLVGLFHFNWAVFVLAIVLYANLALFTWVWVISGWFNLRSMCVCFFHATEKESSLRHRIHRKKKRERERERQRQRQRQRETERQRQRETERDRERQRQRETETERKREREREREMQRDTDADISELRTCIHRSLNSFETTLLQFLSKTVFPAIHAFSHMVVAHHGTSDFLAFFAFCSLLFSELLGLFIFISGPRIRNMQAFFKVISGKKFVYQYILTSSLHFLPPAQFQSFFSSSSSSFFFFKNYVFFGLFFVFQGTAMVLGQGLLIALLNSNFSFSSPWHAELLVAALGLIAVNWAVGMVPNISLMILAYCW